jgi:hypothetical protein
VGVCRRTTSVARHFVIPFCGLDGELPM